jgi:hypothetical protein
MREPDNAILELDFYFPDRSEKQAFEQVIQALIGQGAKFVGTGRAHTGDYAEEPFGFLTDLPSEEVQVDSNNFDALMKTSSFRLFKVDMLNAVGSAGPDLKETVAYVGLPKSDDKHPIGIYTDGEPFSYPREYINVPKAKNAGLKIYERFITLARLTKPAYGAVLVEDYLDNPTTLRASLERNTTDTFFMDFYLNRSFIGEDNLVRICELYQGAYFEELDNGIYISCYEYFNPQNISLSFEHRQLSLKQMIEAAKLIVDRA